MLLVMIDRFSKWTELVPLRSATAESLKKAFRERIIARYRVPKVVITDNGVQIFKSWVSDNSKELADNLAALGKITRIRRQVKLADGRCGGIDEQLEVEIAFGNKQLSTSLLILRGVVVIGVGMELSNTSRN